MFSSETPEIENRCWGNPTASIRICVTGLSFVDPPTIPGGKKSIPPERTLSLSFFVEPLVSLIVYDSIF